MRAAAGRDRRSLPVNDVVHFHLAPGQLSAGRHRCVLSDPGLDERMQALSTHSQRRRSRRDKTQSPPLRHLWWLQGEPATGTRGGCAHLSGHGLRRPEAGSSCDDRRRECPGPRRRPLVVRLSELALIADESEFAVAPVAVRRPLAVLAAVLSLRPVRQQDEVSLGKSEGSPTGS